MERSEDVRDLAFLGEIAQSRVIFWDRIPIEMEVTNGDKRVVVKNEDLPMARVLDVTLEGRAGVTKFVPICRYQVEEYKFDTSEIHRLIFYSLSIDGIQMTAEYTADGQWRAPTLGISGKKVEGLPGVIANYTDWYIDIEMMPRVIDFWSLRDKFLKSFASGYFVKVAVVPSRSDWLPKIGA